MLTKTSSEVNPSIKTDRFLAFGFWGIGCISIITGTGEFFGFEGSWFGGLLFENSIFLVYSAFFLYTLDLELCA